MLFIAYAVLLSARMESLLRSIFIREQRLHYLVAFRLAAIPIRMVRRYIQQILDGMLMSGMIVGSLLVGLIVGKKELKKVIKVLFALLGIAIILMGISMNFLASSVIIFIIGATMALIDSSLDAFLLHILPDENRDRVFAFLTALMTATVPIGTGMFSVYINLAKTSYIFCVIGVVIVIFACMYGIIDRNK